MDRMKEKVKSEATLNAEDAICGKQRMAKAPSSGMIVNRNNDEREKEIK